MATVVVSSVVPVAREALFGWHERPDALGDLMGNRPGFSYTNHAGNIRPGAQVDVEDTVWGLPVRMTFEHTVYEPPKMFGEEMRQGPFARFVHMHLFEEIEGGTRMTDRLEFSLPWWLGGELACQLLVAPMLRSRFERRHEVLQKTMSAKEEGL